MRDNQSSAAPRTHSRGRRRHNAAASEVTDLAALPSEVRHEPSQPRTLQLCGNLDRLLCLCAMQACPAVYHTLRLLAQQVLADVVAKLPACEAIQLQRVSR